MQESIPDSWQQKFELLDGPKATSLRAVQLILQKIERCENVENQTKVEDKSQKHRKKINKNQTEMTRNTRILVRNPDTITTGTTARIIGRTKRQTKRKRKSPFKKTI